MLAALLQGTLAHAASEAREIAKVDIQFVARADFRREQIDVRPA